MTQPEIESDRITVEDIATRLKISKYAVRQLLRQNIIPNIRNGNLFLINRAVFEEWWGAVGKK